MQRVALLGLGTMGACMAANWLSKGFPLAVWNRTPAKAQGLASKGAKAASTPREAAEGADCIFAMVADDDASRSVWLGADGALAGAKPGAVIIESSTLTPGSRTLCVSNHAVARSKSTLGRSVPVQHRAQSQRASRNPAAGSLKSR